MTDWAKLRLDFETEGAVGREGEWASRHYEEICKAFALAGNTEGWIAVTDGSSQKIAELEAQLRTKEEEREAADARLEGTQKSLELELRQERERSAALRDALKAAKARIEQLERPTLEAHTD